MRPFAAGSQDFYFASADATGQKGLLHEVDAPNRERCPCCEQMNRGTRTPDFNALRQQCQLSGNPLKESFQMRYHKFAPDG